MGRIQLKTQIAAPIERVFDTARDMDIHRSSMESSGERTIAGRTEGLIGSGETVTFRARHFGVTMELTSRVSEFERPARFVDEQVRGPFSWFRHEHRFEPTSDGTLMIDDWSHRSPFGWLGRLVDVAILDRYLRRQLNARARGIRRAAELPDRDQPAAAAAAR